MDTHEGVLRDIPMSYRAWLCEKRAGHETLRSEVSNLIVAFNRAIGARVSAGFTSSKPQLVACVLLRESPLLGDLMAVFRTYLRILPAPFVTELAHKTLPPLVPQEVLRDVASNVFQSMTAGNPRADPLPGSLFGSEMGRIMEVYCAMQFARIIEEETARNTLVITSPKMADDFVYLGFGVANLEKIEPRLSFVGNEYSAVVITSGIIGGINGPPPTYSQTNVACDDLLRIVKALCMSVPDKVAICGSFDYWQGVPDWVTYLAEYYELHAARPHMGCLPMFWVFGSRGRSDRKRIDAMMRAVFHDLQLSGMASSSMRLAGQTRYPFKHKLFEAVGSASFVPRGAWFNVDDAIFNTDSTVVRVITLFLLMKTLGLAPLAIAQGWAGLK